MIRFRRSAVVLSTAAVFLFFINLPASADLPPKRVLVLNSYAPGMLFSDEEVRGIRVNLPPLSEVFIEYMDSKRLSTPGYWDLMARLYREKYSAVRFDLVFSLDDDALRFLLERGKDLFPGVPVVFCGVNDLKREMIEKEPLFAGVVETLEISENISTGLMLVPRARRVLVITDNTTSGKANRKTIEDLARLDFIKVPVVFLDSGEGLMLGELTEKLRDAPKDSIVYHADFFQDRSGDSLPVETVMPEVSKAAPGPVFVHGFFYMGLGAAGGKVVSGFRQGEAAAGIAKRIWAGERPESIGVIQGDVNRYTFDARELDRWGISRDSLPQGAEVVEFDPTFYERYAPWILGTAAFIGIETFVIALLLASRRRRLKTEAELRESRNYNRVLFDDSHVPLLVMDPARIMITDCNTAAVAVSGLAKREDLVGRDTRDFSASIQPGGESLEEAVPKRIAECLAKGSVVFEWLIKRPNGEIWDAELHVVPFSYQGRTLFQISLTDITQRKAAEEKIHRLNADLERRVAERTAELSEALQELKKSHDQIVQCEKMAALGQLTAGIAHDLNTPLGSIVSSGRTLKRFSQNLRRLVENYSRLSERARESFGSLLEQSPQSAGAFDPPSVREKKREIADLLSRKGHVPADDLLVERLAELFAAGYPAGCEELFGSPEFELIVTTAHEFAVFTRTLLIVHESAERMRQVIKALKHYLGEGTKRRKAPVDISRDLEAVLVLMHNKLRHGIRVVKNLESLPPVPCYPEKISQVWINLINNALQAMHYSGTLTLSAEASNGWAVVSVEDDGEGVPGEIQDKIFLPFFTTRKKGEGTGLGLDICKNIVEEIGGRITFESVPGKTVFTVFLRTENAEEEESL